MQGVNISRLSLLGSNEKGDTYIMEHLRQGAFMLGYRKKGSINGKHYHKGISPQKDPEILVLLEGRCNLYCLDLKSGKEEHFTLEAPCWVEVSPMIWHELKAITRLIFYEMNSKEAHEKDTFYQLPWDEVQ